jgi:hypothetical protein
MPIRRPEWRRPRWGWLGFALGLVAAAAVWAVPAYLRDGGGFLKEVVLQRDLDIAEHGSAWYGLIAPAIFLSLPAGLYLPLAIRDWRRHGYSGPLACAGVIFLVVQAIPKKRRHYLVPMYPFLALGLGMTIVRHASESTQFRRAACWVLGVGAAIVPVYFALAVPFIENAEDPDLLVARKVLAVVSPNIPIYAMTAQAEPLAWVGQDSERVLELDFRGPQLAGQLRSAPAGAYLVFPADYQEEILREAGPRPTLLMATVQWPRHILSTFLKSPRPRYVNVLRFETSPEASAAL